MLFKNIDGVQKVGSLMSTRTLLNVRVLICACTGFASGLPLYVLVSLIPAWLSSARVPLVEIGLFSLVSLPYTWKFLWAPFLDRYSLPLGLRRGWMLLTQVLLIGAVAALGGLDPAANMTPVLILACVIAITSATQDIAIDAYRRELLPDHELGLGNAVHVQAYRLASLIPGSLALILADQFPWHVVFPITSSFLFVGVVLSVIVREPSVKGRSTGGRRQTALEPFAEYLTRRGWRSAALVLFFMVAYKLGDNMATALATPFYLDLGFSMTQVGVVAKHAALWPAILGALVGGLIMIRLGINRALWIFGAIQMISILGFVWLASVGAKLWVLATVVAFEYLGVGLGTAAFTAFIARESSRAFAATQFALFTAFAALPRSVANASTGFIVESTGWVTFFLLCTVFAIPGMLALIWVAPWRAEVHENQATGNAPPSSAEPTPGLAAEKRESK